MLYKDEIMQVNLIDRIDIYDDKTINVKLHLLTISKIIFINT